MSSLQPARQAQPGTVTQAIRKAASEPTMANMVDAIRAMHDDNAKRWRGQWDFNRKLESDVAAVREGVDRLLDHFDIEPLPYKK